MSKPIPAVRTLAPSEWALWKALRLEMLQLHPTAFGGAYEDECLLPEEDFRQTLTSCTLFGAFDKGVLVGTAALRRYTPQKLCHRGLLFAMYVKEAYRGQGLAHALIQALIQHAKEEYIVQLHCSVVTDNTQALRCYQKVGFSIYGNEPRSLKVNGQYYDEHLLVLNLD